MCFHTFIHFIFFLSQKNYKLVSVPPLIWNGFMGIGNNTAIVANCADLPYDDKEIKRKSAFDQDISRLINEEYIKNNI